MNVSMGVKERINYRTLTILRSNKFFYFLLGLFVFQAAWIALSGVYPMAFDENYHFGLIQLYAHHWSPFFSTQPTSADIFGDVTRDPSYLYHYLMAFPYRFINLFTHDTTNQVIILRFINIGFFLGAVVFFRQLLLKINISKALLHAALLFFILTPVTPLLAAQINYDNLLLMMIPVTMLLTVDIYRLFRQHHFPIKTFILWFSSCILASLVMYTFLPIFAAEFLFLAFILYRESGIKSLKPWLKINYQSLGKWTKVGLLILLVGSLGLFIERDGYNILRYGTPTPECNQVLNDQRCMSYSPWLRNYQILQNKTTFSHLSIWQYTNDWSHTMIYSMFFAINGPQSGYLAYPPLPLPEWTAVVIAFSGVLLIIYYRRTIFHGNDATKLLAVCIAIYALVLFVQNYADYRHLGYPVAVQGRYFVPILLMLYILIGLAFREFLRVRYAYKSILVVIALILFLNGGGLMPFIIRGDSSWEWSNSTVIKANHKAQTILKPVVLGSNI